MATALLAGCGLPESDFELPKPDFEHFAADIQPLVARKCANPSCHGRADRPLSLYAVKRYRRDPAKTFLEAPLTRRELQLNYRRLRGFLAGVDHPERSELLLKPLAPEAGGGEHGGGHPFETRRDADYRELLSWMKTGFR